jgi:hypothetical protein
MKSLLQLSLCLIAIRPVVLGRDLTGVVYSDHSGLSGNGVGWVRLATPAGLIKIHYQKPIKSSFTDDRCWEVGAIWTVRTGRETPGTEELVSAGCEGRVDPQVQSAWIAVRDYIKALAEAAGYQLGYQANRPGPSILKLNNVEFDISGYLDFSSTGTCLEMKRRTGDGAVIIGSSAACSFNIRSPVGGTSYPDIEFVTRKSAVDLWTILEVDVVPKQRPRR